MYTENTERVIKQNEYETLSSFISRDDAYKISHRALFIGFKHRMKVEFLRSFIV